MKYEFEEFNQLFSTNAQEIDDLFSCQPETRAKAISFAVENNYRKQRRKKDGGKAEAK